MLRTIILFIHVASAMGIFAALGIESMVLGQLGRVTDDASVGTALANFRNVKRVEGPSVGLTLLSGFTLAGLYWGWRAGWIDVTLASIVLIVLVGVLVSGRALGKLKVAPTATAVYAARPTFRLSFLLRVWILAGIVFLMTNKPALWPSVIVIAIALVLAFVVDALMKGRERTSGVSYESRAKASAR